MITRSVWGAIRSAALSSNIASVGSGPSLLEQASAIVLAASGALYDPSDLTSLYQSRTGGSTGASGSVVGIMLDKSHMGGQTAADFIAGQAELVTNGGFDADANWTKGTSWTISGGAARAGGTGSSLTQAITFPGASFAVVTYTVTSITSGNVKAQLQGGSASVGAIRTSAGTYTDVLSVNTNTTIAIVSGSTTPDAVVDNVSIKYIPGFHAVAPSDAARPLLTVSGGLAYLTADGVDDWMNVTPTLNLGEQWWHVGGWRSDTGGRYAFALSNAGSGRATLYNSGSVWNWKNASDSNEALCTSNPNAIHVLTLEDDTNIACRFNGVQQSTPFAPYDDSGSTQGLALFSLINSFYGSGMAGRFYGGAFAPGALTAGDRTILEQLMAEKSGVTLA